MSDTPLEIPGAREGATLTGGKIGSEGADFYIRVHEGPMVFSSPKRETTAPTDDGPTFANSGLLYGSLTFRGAMVAGQAIGLASIVSTDKNPCAITFLLGGTRKLTATVLVEQVAVLWRDNAKFVGVAIRCSMSGTDPAALEAAIT